MDGFRRGVNLGGWLSQFPANQENHADAFIRESDIEQIAQWGFDHVRLPVDFQVIEHPQEPGSVREEGYGHIDRCLEWCARRGLGVVLDLHEAPGFTFINDLESETAHRNTLFSSAETQDRFVALWERIVRRYANTDVAVVFELLNEVTLPTNEPWNALAGRTLTALRDAAPQATFMVGGTDNNGVSGLDGLLVTADPGVLYTFHLYDPLLFTHQNAPWAVVPRTWGQSPAYPGELPHLDAFARAHPEWADGLVPLVGRHLDRAYLEEVIAPALDFAAAHGKTLYCGEFGVADWVEPGSRRAWLADVIALFNEHRIGRAIWTYKALNFGLVTAKGDVRDEDYLAIAVSGV